MGQVFSHFAHPPCKYCLYDCKQCIIYHQYLQHTHSTIIIQSCILHKTMTLNLSRFTHTHTTLRLYLKKKNLSKHLAENNVVVYFCPSTPDCPNGSLGSGCLPHLLDAPPHHCNVGCVWQFPPKRCLICFPHHLPLPGLWQLLRQPHPLRVPL